MGREVDLHTKRMSRSIGAFPCTGTTPLDEDGKIRAVSGGITILSQDGRVQLVGVGVDILPDGSSTGIQICPGGGAGDDGKGLDGAIAPAELCVSICP